MSTIPTSPPGEEGSEPRSGRCPLCGGAATHAFTASDLNRAVSTERFEYERCRTCATYFLTPVPADLSRYYPRDYYNPPSANILDGMTETERFKIEMLLEHTDKGRLIEIGPGDGVFARAARNAGFEVTAIEMNAPATEYLRAVVGVEAINSATPEEVLLTLPPSCAIVMWHVIEHLPRPWDVLARSASNLRPGGVLAIATPNPRSLQFRLLGRRWAHLDAPRHLFLIAPDTLAAHCEELGLRLASTTTSDPGGRYWNWFGWEYALRRAPRGRTPALASRALSLLIAGLLRPLEEHGENGCAYTSIFVKSP